MDSSIEPTLGGGADVAAPPPGDAATAPSGWNGPVLRDLESQVDELIEECDRLREENIALRNRQASLASECARLIERSEAVRSRVETMIARLRAMEGS